MSGELGSPHFASLPVNGYDVDLGSAGAGTTSAPAPGAGDGGAVRLPTILPLDERGEVVARGDLRGQYRRCLVRAGELLEAVGLGLESLVRTIDYTTPATREEYSRMGRPRRELLGPVYPGAAGILVSSIGVPGALVALDVVASRYPLEVVNPGWSRYESLTYNPGVKAGPLLFMAGFGALDPETQEAVHEGDVAAQAEYTYGSILTTLAAAGAGPEHLVETIDYLCPPALPKVDEYAAARRAAIGASPVPSVGLACAGLLRPEFLLEVVPTAVPPS